jgi:hypothetical protein
MIRLVGRKADGWLPSLGVLTRDELRAGNEQIDAAAEKGGRSIPHPVRSSCWRATLHRPSAGPADGVIPPTRRMSLLSWDQEIANQCRPAPT